MAIFICHGRSPAKTRSPLSPTFLNALIVSNPIEYRTFSSTSATTIPLWDSHPCGSTWTPVFCPLPRIPEFTPTRSKAPCLTTSVPLCRKAVTVLGFHRSISWKVIKIPFVNSFRRYVFLSCLSPVVYHSSLNHAICHLSQVIRRVRLNIAWRKALDLGKIKLGVRGRVWIRPP